MPLNNDYMAGPPREEYIAYGNADPIPAEKHQSNHVTNDPGNNHNNPKNPGNLANDPAVLTSIVKKEYADFLRNQVAWPSLPII